MGKTQSVNADILETNIQWHPAFCGAAEIDFAANKKELVFQREVNLSKKPLQIDLLIIKKLIDVQLSNELGRIFRRYNVIEYKSPEDSLNIDDLFKTVGYACLYKASGEKANEIPMEEMTVSLFRESRPDGLFTVAQESGFSVQKVLPGVYYIGGLFLPVQVVATGELPEGTHNCLKVLSRKASVADVIGFLREAKEAKTQGERENVDAVLQASMSANYDLYEEIRRRYPEMCEAMRMLMKDELDAAMMTGMRDGSKKTMLETAVRMLKKNATVEFVSECTTLPVDEVLRLKAANGLA